LLLKQEGLLLYLSLSTVGRHVQFLLDIEEQQMFWLSSSRCFLRQEQACQCFRGLSSQLPVRASRRFPTNAIPARDSPTHTPPPIPQLKTNVRTEETNEKEMFNKNIIDNKHPLPQFPNFPTFFSVWSRVYPKEKIPPTKLNQKSSTANFQTPLSVYVCVGSVQLYVCVSKLNLFIVSCSFFIVVRGFFSLGFESFLFVRSWDWNGLFWWSQCGHSR
jgi:hypothetical protein